LTRETTVKALLDANITYDSIQQVFVAVKVLMVNDDHIDPHGTTVKLISETFVELLRYPLQQNFGNAGLEYCEKYGASAERLSMATDSSLYDMTRRAAKDIFENPRITADVQATILIFLAYNLRCIGLCKSGEAHKLIDTSDVAYGHHPLVATRFAQCAGLTRFGLATEWFGSEFTLCTSTQYWTGGAVVVTRYKCPNFSTIGKFTAVEEGGISE
ncbi:13149_t:CDS:2, partial [Dentiscutata erythropus]